jgi:serine/threonine-protein kinase
VQANDSRSVDGEVSEITPSVIAQVEKALVAHVGPMASILVKKYAKQYSDIDSLLEALANHIPSFSEQTQFRTKVSASGLTLVTGASPGTSTSGISGGEAANPGIILSEEEREQIVRMLAKFIGPLASRIVSRGQRDAVDKADFCSRIAENISDQNERGQFLQRMKELLRS